MLELLTLEPPSRCAFNGEMRQMCVCVCCRTDPVLNSGPSKKPLRHPWGCRIRKSLWIPRSPRFQIYYPKYRWLPRTTCNFRDTGTGSYSMVLPGGPQAQVLSKNELEWRAWSRHHQAVGACVAFLMSPGQEGAVLQQVLQNHHYPWLCCGFPSLAKSLSAHTLEQPDFCLSHLNSALVLRINRKKAPNSNNERPPSERRANSPHSWDERFSENTWSANFPFNQILLIEFYNLVVQATR